MSSDAARPSLIARALSGSAATAAGYLAAQVLRLGSNLILTRLLFPEAFGLMALVSVFIVGLGMFSDMGIGPAISRSPRGDEPDFLDTAWTLQVGRGVLLWLAICALAWPAAQFYAAPDLVYLMPVSGLMLLIGGFNPTRIDSATRHLLLGRVIVLDLAAQAAGTVAMILLALATQSVMALALGTVVSAVAKLALSHAYLPGHRNRLRWDAESGRELVHFGKWIFLSTACGFLMWQGDKAILGMFLPLDQLGIYNIGYFLASAPVLLGQAVTGRVLIPLYRNHPPAASAGNFRRLRRMRFGLSAILFALLAVFAFFGGPIVQLLYDDRYAQAGAVTVLVACVQLPLVIGMTYDQSALADGDSRMFFVIMALRAAVQSGAFVLGVTQGGLYGALLAQFCALVAVHPLIIWLARRHRVWDGLHDAVFSGLALLLILAALRWNAALLGI